MSTPDQFTVVGEMKRDFVEDGLRRSPLLNTRDFFPFAEADISFEWVTPEDILPSSLIAVRRKLVRQGAISLAMQNSVAFDQYELTEGGVYLKGGPEGVTGVIPPIIVEGQTESGEPTDLVLDGLHRSYDCFVEQQRSRLFVARIKNASPDWMAYAYANDWDEVRVLDEKPDDKREWKRYVGDPLNNEEYELYVDFGHLNGSRPYVQGEGETRS